MKGVVYLGSMFRRDIRYDMNAERCIVAGNRVNGACSNAVLVPSLIYSSKMWVLQKNI